MKKTNQFLVAFLGILLLTACVNIFKTTKPKWVNLLEGSEASNWIVKITQHPVNVNYKNTFQINNGVLSVSYDDDYNFDKTFGHIFYHKELSHYKLKLEYRFKNNQTKGGKPWAKCNSGIMIHCESPFNMTQNQLFPMSIEVQLLGGLNDGKERTTANVCTPGTSIMIDGELRNEHCVKSVSKTYNNNQWVQVEVEVYGNDLIVHKINGKEVIRYSNPVIGGSMIENKKYWTPKIGTKLKKGYFSLQSESHPVEFRNIYLMEL